MTNNNPSQNFENAKTCISVLSYEEKIILREFLEEQINKEMADHTKKRAQEVSEQFGNFIDKAAEKTKTGVNSLKNSFNQAFNKDIE